MKFYVNCSCLCVIVFFFCGFMWLILLQTFMSPKLSVIALSIVPPIALLSRIYGRYVQNITKQVQDSLAGATQVTISVLLWTHTHPFNGPFLGLPRWAGARKVKPIWILLKQETVSGSGISCAICKSAPHSRQITMPAPHHSVYLQAGCPSCRPTNSIKALKAQCVVMNSRIIFTIFYKTCSLSGFCTWLSEIPFVRKIWVSSINSSVEEFINYLHFHCLWYDCHFGYLITIQRNTNRVVYS